MGIIDEITILEKYSEDMSPADTYKCKLKSNILPKKDWQYVSATIIQRARGGETV